MMGALSYLVPVNATILQANVRGSSFVKMKSHQGTEIVLVGVAAVIAIIGSAILLLMYPVLLTHLLGLDASMICFRWLVLAAPFYILIPLVAAILLGQGSDKFVLRYSLVTLPIVVGISAVYGAAIGFVGGCMTFVLGFIIVALKNCYK
jgi:hypothetical protein